MKDLLNTKSINALRLISKDITDNNSYIIDILDICKDIAELKESYDILGIDNAMPSILTRRLNERLNYIRLCISKGTERNKNSVIYRLNQPKMDVHIIERYNAYTFKINQILSK